LFLVPQESWGWIPAHMGTWVWLDRGWTWIPGDWFHSGMVEFLGISTFPTMDYYFLMGYGFNIFRQYGLQDWRLDNLRRYYREVWEQIRESWIIRADLEPNPGFLPDKLANIIKRANQGPAADVAKRLGLEHTLSASGVDKLPADRGAKLPQAIPDAAGKARPVPELGAKNEITHLGKKGAARDWNPDRSWADARGYTIHYSSSRNAVICPELNISSDREHLQSRGGAYRYPMPGRGTFPESSPQAGSPDSGSTNGTIASPSQDKKAEEKDNSGK
jgi:hypothetical protein